MGDPNVLVRLGDQVDHVGKIHTVMTIMVTEFGSRAMLVDQAGKIRWVQASSHSKDNRWCIACLSLSNKVKKNDEIISDDELGSYTIRIQMNQKTHKRMNAMCKEREVSPDYLFYRLLWDAKEGGICRDQDE